ncbi:MAG: hypothetical protein VCD66_03220 [Alphaproteobacteria bacterium]
MYIANTAAFLFLAMITATMLPINPALAHGFRVALIVPGPNAGSVQGGQFQKGFMLAATERDGHPDQESDGHLGGLDVYVEVIYGQGDIAAGFRRIVARGEVSIAVAFGSDATIARVRKFLDGKAITLLPPGQSPFARSETAPVAAFIAAYKLFYGHGPTSQAAQGYNAARRIDVAVRAQGGVSDPSLLRASFRATARGFSW